jgi:hypothetical protein
MAIVIADYPFVSTPMWGGSRGQPSHLIVSAIERNRPLYNSYFDRFFEFRDLIHSIPNDVAPGDVESPYWNQTWFSALDAAALIGFIATERPRRYIEIGSGNSTKFARFAIKTLGLSTKMMSIDPTPRAEIDSLCDAVIRANLQDCELVLFDELEEGDILFFDGSHRVFTNSDVSFFFFKVLPRLNKGVIVHIHDIFLPDDYPESWSIHYYSEQYLLAAFLMGDANLIEPIFPNYFISKDEKGLAKRLSILFDGNPRIPTNYQNAGNTPGVSFWCRCNFPLLGRVD